MSTARIQRVGFVGIGNMGWPMAANLVRAGFDVAAVDAEPGRADADVSVVLKGGRLAPLTTWVHKGDVFAVAQVRRGGQRAVRLPDTLLQVEAPGGTRPAQTAEMLQEALPDRDDPPTGYIATEGRPVEGRPLLSGRDMGIGFRL